VPAASGTAQAPGGDVTITAHGPGKAGVRQDLTERLAKVRPHGPGEGLRAGATRGGQGRPPAGMHGGHLVAAYLAKVNRRAHRRRAGRTGLLMTDG